MTDHTNHERSAYYHNDDLDDPFVEDHNRPPVDDDYYPCPVCQCGSALDAGCRCSCHNQRRYH